MDIYQKYVFDLYIYTEREFLSIKKVLKLCDSIVHSYISSYAFKNKRTSLKCDNVSQKKPYGLPCARHRPLSLSRHRRQQGEHEGYTHRNAEDRCLFTLLF